jgi:hypothetical protein
VTLSAAAAGTRTVSVTTNTHRQPRAGYAYWFILEVHDVSGTHSEFYPRQNLAQAGPTFTLTIPADADVHQRRTGQVLEVDGATSQRFTEGHPDAQNADSDYLLELPCICRVSNEIALPYQ